jgi:hypothetical protein
VTFEDCVGDGVERGFHNDTGGTSASLLRCSFMSSWSDISFQGGASNERRILIADDCDFGADIAVDIGGNADTAVVLGSSCRLHGTRVGSVAGANSRLFVSRRCFQGPKMVFQVFLGAPNPIVTQ